jgi:ATP-dependent RNA helicase DeaD
MPTDDSSLDLVVLPLQAPLRDRGITALTPVQRAVLDPSLDGFDLRIRSRTGSGKTVAIGLVLAPHLERDGAGSGGPLALVVVPTRELAAQVQAELAWLLAGIKVNTVAVTGGTSVGGERRQLSVHPELVVGTPGRLLDHLQRGGIDPSSVRAVVLDEADQMLDLGFRDELEGILSRLPQDRQTHMVSATFSPEAQSLCERYQRESRMVDASRPGEANEDIEHLACPVLAGEREAALINLLLLSPDDRTLVFVRTRIQASEIAEGLSSLGFSAAALSGEMEQRERTRTLTAFRTGALRTLVATDVAARGIDVPDVNRVIHIDPPENAEALTHRSGRTGRAGKKGMSIVLVPPQARYRVTSLFRQANVRVRWTPPPGEAEVRWPKEPPRATRPRPTTRSSISCSRRCRRGCSSAACSPASAPAVPATLAASPPSLIRTRRAIPGPRAPSARATSTRRPPTAQRPLAGSPGAPSAGSLSSAISPSSS